MSDLKDQKGNYILSIIPERNIIKSDASGLWTIDTIKNHEEDIKKWALKFGGQKWAFMPDIAKMAPIIDNETSEAFIKLHKVYEEAGCTAIAFVEGRAIVIKVQAQRHQDNSNVSKLSVNHFRDDEAALNWLKSIGI